MKLTFFLITYADSITTNNQKHLQTLSYFLENYCYEFSFIHILPFFPFSSDDGFAVINYEEVDSNHGNWSDLKKLSSKFKIMIDLVINHCSSKNNLFKKFLKSNPDVENFFITSDKKFNESLKIVRPRSSKLSKEVKINGKKKYVWCTFSHDQIDFNFKNPNVLVYFLKVIKFYLDKNVKALRLDAVAFLWKQIGNKLVLIFHKHMKLLDL